MKTEETTTPPELAPSSFSPVPAAKGEMSMMTWLATEGGRKCPACGKYAKADELGYTGFSTGDMIVSSYGHLPGHGCNIPAAGRGGFPAGTEHQQ